MRRSAVVAVAFAVAACSRDTSLPAPPGPGSIQGRVVYAVAGQSTRVAASGARVTVLGTSIGATTGSDGRFVVSGAPSDGDLLVQADLDGDGKPDRQTLLSLSTLGAHPGRDLALGDVVVVENARLRGRVLRGDVPGPSGHAGIVVFVPQGPFTTLTGDDGSYLFENLPEGRLSLTFFKDGYAPAGVDGIQLGAGQDFTVRDVTLSPAPPPGGGTPAPGTVAGQLTFSPAASGAGARVFANQLVPDPAFVASVPAAASGAFQLGALPPGLYQLEAAKPGYATAVVSNVMVGAGSTVQLAISLAAQGVSVDPVQVGTIPTCVAGAACTLPNPCQVGQVGCAIGAPVCAPIGNALDGIPCGSNQVCSAGACVSVCVAGASCHPPADPCHEGVVSCSTGTPTCVAGTAALANGTACGANQVCNAGACTSCFAGVTCTPTNACDTGLTECSTGAQTCRDTGLAVGDGVSCGSSLFCASGVCGACQPGKPCTPAGFPCHTGTTSCATGREVCVDGGAVLGDGTSCGTDLVCRSGACLACAAGAACTPTNACHTGAVACGSGLPVCVDQQANAAAGSGCGADHVCDGAGSCVACVQGQACTPTNRCHAGGIQCATGAPVCGDLAVNLANGTPCGQDQVCDAGTCVPCVANADCTPQNPCHYGKTSCVTGVSACGDTNVPLANGATCGTDLVCAGGGCVPCATGAACGSAVAGAAPLPGTVDACRQYLTVCASGTPACDGSASQPDGTPCGSGLICRAGSCQTSPMAIVVASGDGQHALPNQPLPQLLAVTIRDVLTQSGVAGQTVSVIPPAGAQVDRASATTDPSGVATFALTLGRAVGPQPFVVRHDPSYPSTTAVTEYADAPADGTVIPLVNAARLSGTSPITGAGPAVRTANVYGVAAASNGDVYFADQSRCQVRKLSPAGVVSVVAGTGNLLYGSCPGSSGDGGLALDANLNPPRGLALDEANRILYVADSGGNRVRAVDLRTGFISTVAGNGTTGSAPYGDGGDATAAQLSQPLVVALGPGPTPVLYVLDAGHSLVRRVDPATGLISTVVSTGCTGAVGIQSFNGGSGTGTGALAVDARGRLFVGGVVCGTSMAAQAAGVVRVEPDGTLVRVAGTAGAGLGSGPALGGGFQYVNALAFDAAVDGSGSPAQNLYVADAGKQAIVRIDGVTGRMSLAGGVVGSTTSTGDFGPGSAATFYIPGALAVAPGTRDLLVGEVNGNALRLVSGAASTAATRALLARAGGDAQAVYPDQGLPAPLAVSLTEGTGTPVAGFPVRFALDPTGNGGGWLSGAAATTTSGGVAVVNARVGLKLGATRFVASFDDLHGNPIPGSPVTFTATATAPPAGTVFTVVNDGHVVAPTAPPTQPGTASRVGATYASALLPDGSLLFADQAPGDNEVWVPKLSPDGTLSLFAGCWSGCSASDGVPATLLPLTTIEPGVAASPDGTTVYLGNPQGARVHAVSVATGLVVTIAGTGTNGAGTGDGGPATAATLYYPGALSVAGGSLYVASVGQNREGIRRIGVDPANAAEYGNIYAFLPPGASFAGQTTGLATVPSPTAPPTAWGCGSWDRCMVTADPSGVLYVSGYFFGTGFEGTNTASPGIARVDPSTGALVRIAGRASAVVPSPGLALERAGFAKAPTIAFDRAGNLWVANPSGTASQNVVGWIAPDPVTGHVEASGILNQVGQTTSTVVPAAGSYVPVASAYLGTPYAFAFTADGHVLFTDAGTQAAQVPSYAVRMIW